MNGPSRFDWKTAHPIGRIAWLVWPLLVLAATAGAAEPPSAEKAAPADARKPMREVEAEGYRVQLDLSKQVLELYVPNDEDLGWNDAPRRGDQVAVGGNDAKLMKGDRVVARLSMDQRLSVTEVRGKWIGAFIDLNGERKRGWVNRDEVWLCAREAPVVPTLSGLGGGGFVSASILAQKAKQFDDGLYAAVELAAQRGAGGFQGKSLLLASLARSLAPQDAQQLGGVAGVVLGAGNLGKLDVEIPAKFQPAVQQTVERFLKNQLRSKPIGFYTWSDELGAIFQQDRLLQNKLEGKAGIEVLVRSLHADKRARAAYEQYLTLVARLTNPLVDPDSPEPRADPDLRKLLAALDDGKLDAPSKGVFFFPPSRTHETRLIMQLFGTRPIPEGFNLADEMIRRIRSGELQLQPTAESGWYDHQSWALEPLVIPEKMPEAKHLRLDDTYREQLIQLFKGILALTRETHVKQAELPTAGEAAPPEHVVIEIYPELSAEPLATHYLRRALCYRFIRTVLKGTFGAEALGQMHRHTAAGPVEQNLAAELDMMEALLYGAYVTVSRQLGMVPDTSLEVGSASGARADAEQFLKWAAKVKSDPDVGQDARMMVPVFYDIARRKTKVWAFLGWSTRPVEVDFAMLPAAVVLDKAGNRVPADRVELQFHSRQYTLAYPVTADVYVAEILDRDQFRRHCDKYQIRSAILANLK